MPMTPDEISAAWGAMDPQLRDHLTIQGHEHSETSAKRRMCIEHVASLADDALAAFQCADTDKDRAALFLKVARERVAELLRHIEAKSPEEMPRQRQSDRE